MPNSKFLCFSSKNALNCIPFALFIQPLLKPMAKNLDHSPFLFPSTAISYPSESAPSSSSSPLPPSFCSSRSNSSFNSPYKSSSQPPLSHASSGHFPPPNFGPCAACTIHNRRCSDKCYVASFLPPSEAHNFAVVDSLFGSGNVVNFLQHNSNTSYTPLLLLLSREDEIDSNPRISTAVVNATDRPSKSPLYKDATSGGVNFFETAEFSPLHNGNAKKRKTLPIWTEIVRVRTENGLESALDDGYSWIKYGQKEVRGAIYPRSYYRCFHRDTQNCWATKRVKRSDEDPNIFEISYRRVHICSRALPGKQHNISGNNQRQQLQGTLFNFQPLPESPSLDPELSVRPLQLDLSLTLENGTQLADDYML